MTDYASRLVSVANENDCDEFTLFVKAMIDYTGKPVNNKQLDTDFGHYVLTGEPPIYVRWWLLHNLLEA